MGNLVTTQEAAAILERTTMTISNLVKAGKLKPVIGGKHRGDQMYFDRDDVEKVKGDMPKAGRPW